MSETKSETKLAIRFGLGAIKAVGFNMMESTTKERRAKGKFKDIYDFAERLNPKVINKKSIEALAKAGAFDSLSKNRKQIAESFEIISAYSVEKNEEALSSQMSLFSESLKDNIRPELKKISDWEKEERLQKEFEAFGFFLNEHPIDDFLPALRKRGIVFSNKLDRDELADGSLVKMAGILASSKHRSGSRGRFAYLTISDPFGIFEAMIFDEALITSARDVLIDGSAVALECLVRKDDGGIRILVREVKRLDDFIKNTEPSKQDFEDIQRQIVKNSRDVNRGSGQIPLLSPVSSVSCDKVNKENEKKVFREVLITPSSRNSILILKSFLSQRITKQDTRCEGEVYTKVFFMINQKNKIELPGEYSLTEIDVLRIKNIDGISKVLAS